MLGDETDQPLATARDRQVDQVGQLQQFQHVLAGGVLYQRYRLDRQVVLA